MKLTIKTLKQVSYTVEIDQEASVASLKQEIEAKHSFDSKSMKLLYSGSVLEDQKILSEIGIKDGHVIMMMNAKARPQNIAKEEIKEEKKQEEPVPSSIKNETEKVNIPSVSKVLPAKDFSKEIQSLAEMGFSQEMSKNAIEAAKGNVNLAIDYLYNGIPSNQGQSGQNPQLSEFMDEEEEYEPIELDPEILNNLDLNDPNTLKTIASIVKIIIQEDPSQLSNILSDIEETNPEIIDFIKEHETEFKSLIEQPISPQDLLLFQSLAGSSDQQLLPEEGDDDNEDVPEGIQNILNMAQNLHNSGPSDLTSNLSQTDKESVDRLKNLGFSEEEAVQAFMACDKNETLAANFLFDNRFKDDMNIDCKIKD
jgi:UV excision repair protein RAD23